MKAKQPNEYIYYRIVRPGYSVALDVLPGGSAAIIASCAMIAAIWEYHNLIAAEAAWNVWNPLSNDEPQGYARRCDASSKVTVEML